MPKALSEMNEEEVEALSDDERAELEQAEEEAGDGEPGSERRRSLYTRFSETRAERNRLTREAEELRNQLADERSRRVAREEVARATPAAVEEEDPDPAPPTAPAPVDVADLRRQKAKLLKDGDFDGASAIDDRIDTYNEARNRYMEERADWREVIAEKRVEKATRRAEEAGTTAAERAERAANLSAAADITKEFPFLDGNNKKANKVAIAAVKGMRDDLIRDGMSAADAIRQAGREVGEQFADKGGKGDGKGDGKDRGKSRREEEIERGARHADRTPPSTPRSGSRTLPRDPDGKVAARKLTDDQIRRMSPEDISREFGRASEED